MTLGTPYWHLLPGTRFERVGERVYVKSVAPETAAATAVVDVYVEVQRGTVASAEVVSLLTQPAYAAEMLGSGSPYDTVALDAVTSSCFFWIVMLPAVYENW